MRSATYWTHCLSTFEALRDGRLEEAERHLAEAAHAVPCENAAAEPGRRALLQRYQALLAGRRGPSRPAATTSAGTSRPVPAISLVTTCFNRFWQLRQTLPGNLATIRSEPDVEMVLVDFGGADSQDIANFVEREFALDLLSGKLKYFVAKVPWTRFRACIAKNAAHRLSSGRFIFSLDGDNHFRPEDLALVREHLREDPRAVLHQTTGPAQMRHRTWSKYGLLEAPEAYHELPLTWDGSTGRIGMSREVFERVNGYDESFLGVGMDDIDLLIRCIRSGSSYRHIRLARAPDEVFIDNGSADPAHEHDYNQHNWKLMDEAFTQGRVIAAYAAEPPQEHFACHVPALVRRSAQSRVTLFSSLCRIEPFVARFLHDLQQIRATPGICVWLLDVVGSHTQQTSEALRGTADGETVFYVPVHLDPGLYALWNIAIGAIASPFLGNLNADDLRGSGWLVACLAPLEAGLADVASPITVPFGDAVAVDAAKVIAQLREGGDREIRWFQTRCVVEGAFPDERVRHEPLIDGDYTQQDLFQVLPDGALQTYCIPNASAVWSRRVHELAGAFDEPRYGCFADLALWAEAGSRGLRFLQVDYPALFFISEQQAHRRQSRNEDKLIQLAFRHGAPTLRRWLARRQFDLSRIGGSYGEHHFKGWNWVRDEVASHFRHTSQRVLLDMFVERAFFWNPNPDEAQFVHRQPWLGFIHTTPHSSPAFDQQGQNLDTLLTEPRFSQSLENCRGLIVLSENNQRYLRDRLRPSHASIPIYRLFHPNIPLEEAIGTCSVDLGTEAAPKVFHIGWHLRAFSAFARLRVDRARKVLLVPSVFPVEQFVREVVDRELRLQGMGRAEDYFAEVYTASQADYVHILRRGIVFNHYLHPAGSNLISECISTGTRLVVNRHPAFEEYLGADYPLFFDSTKEADTMVELASSAPSGPALQEHLAVMRERWSIGRFCRDLERIGEDVYARS